MFCGSCGKQIPDNASFCPECGKETISGSKANLRYQKDNGESNAQQGSSEEACDPVKYAVDGSILTFALLGLAFTITLIFSFMGVVFSTISRIKLKKYVIQYGVPKGRANAGNIIGLIAFVISIVITSILALIIAFAIFA